MKPNQGKYIPFRQIALPARAWPGRAIERAPAWCSVDLRDGNQALVNPMSVQKKLEFFQILCEIGFKEIEIGFPSASDAEFETCRRLIEDGLIPDGVRVQVITQAREHLIRKTFEAVRGAKEVIVHLYAPISTLQREVVFEKDMDGIIQIAVDSAKLIHDLAQADQGRTKYIFEYSPESFSGAEVENSVRIIDAVMEAFQASEEKPAIIDMTATVELCTPNTFADQVEYVLAHMKSRKAAIASVHPHNDRGTGVACAELALLAGAERVEGTLFGNGERTGNADLITLALNLFTQGIDPGLDLSNLPALRESYERLTGMRVHERQPYSGDLVFTAFSGSHQDAIRKGRSFMERRGEQRWMVPYLPIDPADIGRQFDPIVRINSLSGKGGAAFVMQEAFGYRLPRGMHAEFGALVQAACERKGEELSNQELYEVFRQNYLDFPARYRLLGQSFFSESGENGSSVRFQGRLEENAENSRVIALEGMGNGPIDAFFNALRGASIAGYTFLSYDEHAISAGSDAQAIAYIELKTQKGGAIYGVGIAPNINMASIQGVLGAINRAEHLGL
ncbi:MAG: 2-isopropylmalate synthase [Christensenellaceae bacterium]|nr:2-isopropylmalate synthase [Christensenellaceae bacterium]